ncbi:unnamed protein product [Lepidochelys olivacea]
MDVALQCNLLGLLLLLPLAPDVEEREAGAAVKGYVVTAWPCTPRPRHTGDSLLGRGGDAGNKGKPRPFRTQPEPCVQAVPKCQLGSETPEEPCWRAGQPLPVSHSSYQEGTLLGGGCRPGGQGQPAPTPHRGTLPCLVL